jgi:methyl-accepting chemotaxis protein
MGFIDGVVLEDYNRLGDLANSYKQDAGYYADVSRSLGAKSNELSGSLQNITVILNTISSSQDEVDDAIQSVNGNLQQLTYASEDVAGKTKSVMDSVENLKEVMSSFHVD